MCKVGTARLFLRIERLLPSCKADALAVHLPHCGREPLLLRGLGALILLGGGVHSGAWAGKVEFVDVLASVVRDRRKPSARGKCLARRVQFQARYAFRGHTATFHSGIKGRRFSSRQQLSPCRISPRCESMRRPIRPSLEVQ